MKKKRTLKRRRCLLNKMQFISDRQIGMIADCFTNRENPIKILVEGISDYHLDENGRDPYILERSPDQGLIQNFRIVVFPPNEATARLIREIKKRGFGEIIDGAVVRWVEKSLGRQNGKKTTPGHKRRQSSERNSKK